jgi:hypothetical protein
MWDGEVPIEKQVITQLVKNFFTFRESEFLIITITACHWTLS